MRRAWAWVVHWLGTGSSQWEEEREERHRIGNELVRQWRVRSLRP